MNSVLETYNVRWGLKRKDAGESAYPGGHGTGCNVRVEKDEILVYITEGSDFDEGRMIDKAERIRVSILPNPFSGSFKQKLNIEEGYIELTGKDSSGIMNIRIWTDINSPVLHIDINSDIRREIRCIYETWQGDDGAFTHKDTICVEDNWVLFHQRNALAMVLNEMNEKQGLQEMLIRAFDRKIFLLPAWLKNLDVDFKLWVDEDTFVEVSYRNGVVKYLVTPETRMKDVVLCRPSMFELSLSEFSKIY